MPGTINTAKRLFQSLSAILTEISLTILELFIPRKWLRTDFEDVMRVGTDEERLDLLVTFIEANLSELQSIGLVAALIGGVISSSISWTTFAQTPWFTKATWYSGLLLSLTSIICTGLNSGVLFRIRYSLERSRRGMDDGLSDSRRQLLWHPTAIQAWAWGMPGIMLKLGIGAFLMGLLFDLWGAVSSEALQWQNSDVKIASVFTIIAAFSFFSYLSAVFTIFFKY